MILNRVWIAFILIAFLTALFRSIGFFIVENTNIELAWASSTVFTDVVQSTFDMAKISVEIAIYLIGLMTLWLGIMRIGEKGGALNALTRLFSPFFKKIFPDVPSNHPAMGNMVMNFCANMLSLDNAATPMGLKAMKELQELNNDKETASNAQIMFLVLNTSGLTLIPVSIMALRAAAGAQNPSDIFIPLLITTFFSTLAGLTAVSIYQKINLLNKTVLLYLGSLTLLIATILYFFINLPAGKIEPIASFAGNAILILFIVVFVLLAMKNKINVYEHFIDGAKDGFKVAINIIPYLVAMLLSIGMLRASGALDFIIDGVEVLFSKMGLNTEFVGALPVGFMKPLSGSGARGLMVEAMNNYGADSFVGRLASTFQGSTETTFYTLAVYYGAVNVKRTRYTLTCGLIADFTAIIAAIIICYIFFG